MRLRLSTAALGAASLAIAATSSGIVLASPTAHHHPSATPHNRVFHACIGHGGAHVLFNVTVSPAHHRRCHGKQRSVTWNERGRPGPRGRRGHAGPRGHVGPRGLPGVAGTPGYSGNGVRHGQGAPKDGVGQIGDFYLDTRSLTLYGPKNSDGWPPYGTSLRGAPGQRGSSVLNGRGAPDDETGAVGDFYIDTESETIYGPKNSDGWPADGTSLGGRGGGSTFMTGAVLGRQVDDYFACAAPSGVSTPVDCTYGPSQQGLPATLSPTNQSVSDFAARITDGGTVPQNSYLLVVLVDPDQQGAVAGCLMGSGDVSCTDTGSTRFTGPPSEQLPAGANFFSAAICLCPDTAPDVSFGYTLTPSTQSAHTNSRLRPGAPRTWAQFLHFKK